MPMRVDVFSRTYNRVPERARVRVGSVVVEDGAGLVAILEAALAAGMPKGNGTNAGPFEVQTDRGMWSHPAEKSLLAWRGGRFVVSELAAFRTWDQIEAEEG